MAVYPSLRDTLRSSLSIDRKFERIRVETPDLRSLEVMHYLLCLDYGNGIIDATVYQDFMRGIWPGLRRSLAEAESDTAPIFAATEPVNPQSLKPAGVNSTSLEVPPNVESLWLFFQHDGAFTEDNCIGLGTFIRDDFVRRFEELRSEGRRLYEQTPGTLVVTALSHEGAWVQGQIKLDGRPLRSTSYMCNGFPAGGAAVPLN